MLVKEMSRYYYFLVLK